MKKFIILIPVYNDWKSVFKLLNDIDLEIAQWNNNVSILIVNDGSTEEIFSSKLIFQNIKSVKILNMKLNQGHGRCNATGLKYISQNEDYDYVITMDADGEDRPEELSLFFETINKYSDKVITADRVKRTEGLIFKFCYFIHKYITFIFTGQSIKFGNYTCLPKEPVVEMLQNKSTWSSFSGSIGSLFKDRISIPSTRGSRYFGPSKMSFFSLLKHSLSIMAVFKNIVILRSVIFLIVYFFLIFNFLSVITIIPLFLILFFIFLILQISKRENLDELKNSLSNIDNIKKFN